MRATRFSISARSLFISVLAGKRADFFANAGNTVKTRVQDTVQRAAVCQ